MPVQSIPGKMKLNKYKADSNADSDSVAQHTPRKAAMMLKQSSMPNLGKRKSKQERQAQAVQSMNISATVRSNSSSLVAAQAAAGQPQHAQNHSYAAAPSGSSAE